MTTDDGLKGLTDRELAGFVSHMIEVANTTFDYENWDAAMVASARQWLAANIHDSGDSVDAARYRWLRDNSAEQFAHPIVVSQDKRETGIRYFGPVIGKSLDKAIDAAILAEKGEV